MYQKFKRKCELLEAMNVEGCEMQDAIGALIDSSRMTFNNVNETKGIEVLTIAEDLVRAFIVEDYLGDCEFREIILSNRQALKKVWDEEDEEKAISDGLAEAGE